MYIHLQKKCSGLESENQYTPDYRYPKYSNDGDGELNNHPNEQIESVKTAGRKRKITEKEGPPEKK